MKKVSIVGVSGTGKSTYAQYLASRIRSKEVNIVPTDMIKDGLRFMISKGIFPENLTPEEIYSIREPSKKCDIKTGSRAAYTVSKIKNVLSETLVKYEDDRIFVFEGFFIPNTDEEITLITADESWLEKIHGERMILRHGRKDNQQIKRDVNNLVSLQEWFVNELDKNKLNYNIVSSPVNIPLIDNFKHKFLNLEDYLKEMFFKLGVDQDSELARKYFMKGLNHAYRRTTDLK